MSTQLHISIKVSGAFGHDCLFGRPLEADRIIDYAVFMLDLKGVILT